MAEIEEEVTFIVNIDNVRFTTRTNGDSITIQDLDLDQGQAASFAWLINHSGELQFNVKVKP